MAVFVALVSFAPGALAAGCGVNGESICRDVAGARQAVPARGPLELSDFKANSEKLRQKPAAKPVARQPAGASVSIIAVESQPLPVIGLETSVTAVAPSIAESSAPAAASTGVTASGETPALTRPAGAADARWIAGREDGAKDLATAQASPPADSQGVEASSSLAVRTETKAPSRKVSAVAPEAFILSDPLPPKSTAAVGSKRTPPPVLPGKEAGSNERPAEFPSPLLDAKPELDGTPPSARVESPPLPASASPPAIADPHNGEAPPAVTARADVAAAPAAQPHTQEAAGQDVATAPVEPDAAAQPAQAAAPPPPAPDAPATEPELVEAPKEAVKKVKASPKAHPAPPAEVREPPSVVETRLADAPGQIDGYKVNLNDMRAPVMKRTPPKGTPRTLAETILSAISDNALIKAGEGTAAEALAAIGTASAALYPQLQGRLAVGPNAVTSWQAPRGPGSPYFNRKNAYGALRGDFSLTGEQLIYDFGSTQSNITKAAAGTEAQNWSVLSTTEEVAFKTATSYLKILEDRELLDLASENLVSLEEIANLVNENQKNGNGTVADVKRVNARVIDAASAKADQEYALKLASDELRRLIHMDPGPLSPPPTLSKFIPPDDVKALAAAIKTNPRILSYRASIDARLAEIRSLKQGNLPKVVAEVSASNKQYQAVNDKTDFDISALLAVRYKFLDGGFNAAQIEGVQARMFQDEMRMRDTRETIESDLRRDYFTLRLSRGKTASLAEGVDLNTKARSLYREQFRGGKRSLLELLEVQNAYYLSKRSQITNLFEERRANFSILRLMGRFAVTALTFK